MAPPSSSLPVTYHSALTDHLAHPTEATLQQAYELGRAAMSAGLGVFDVIRLHHQALQDGALSKDPLIAANRAPMLEAFLLEVLSPFEAAHRGFRRAWERLEQLNNALAGHNEALALSNAQLEEEITMRQRTETELRESKDHYMELFKKAHAMEEALRELSAEVLTVQEEERKRISRELHDEIGQALTAVNVSISVLKKHVGSNAALKQKVAESEELLTQCMESVHSFARELRPSMLDHLGVAAALRSHISVFSERTGLPVELVPHDKLSEIQGQRGEVIFRIVQEALNNVVKHAQATKAKVAFATSGDKLTMEVSDNGKAFSVEEKLSSRSGRLGLIGMQERVRLVNGTFAIDSTAGRGTRITVEIPLEPPPSTSAPANAQPETNDTHENIRIAR